MRKKLKTPDDRPRPDVRRSTGSGRPTKTVRPTISRLWTSDLLRTTDTPTTEPIQRISEALRTTNAPDVRTRPNVQPKPTRAEFTNVRRAPDVWTLASLGTTGNSRTSDACVLFVCWAVAHVPLRPLRLYIDLLLLFYRVSKGLAHILCESFAHPLGYLLLEDSSLHRRRSPKQI